MKKFKLFFALFAMLALNVGNAWGAEETYTLGWGSASGTNFTNFTTTSGEVANVVSFTTAKNNSTTDPAYNSKNKDLRLYYNAQGNGGSITLTPADGVTITGFVMTTSTTPSVKYTVNNGTATAVSQSNKVYTVTDISASQSLKIQNVNTSNTQLRIKTITITYIKESGEKPAYSVKLNQPATGGTISAEGLTDGKAAKGVVVKLTATPDAGYEWESWTVTGASGNVEVSNDQFTMPAEDVTVTASFVAKTQYTIKWNVAEGSVEDSKVYEGEALGTLPTAPNCSSGKVFRGWTEATSVNPDGSGITYVKETDVPTGDKEYNAVYATQGVTVNKVDKLDLSFTGVSGSAYSSWSGKKSVSDAVYAGNNAGGNDAIQLRYDTSKAAAGIITTTSGGKATKVVISWNSNTTKGRTLNVYGNNTLYSDVKDLWEEQPNQGTLLGTIVKGTSTELVITGDYAYIGLRSASSAMYLDKVEITWEATNYSDYSLNCDINEAPALIPSREEIDFGAKYVGFEYSEEFTINATNLKGDITLAVTGDYFDVTPKTIASNASFPQTVAVTYKPEVAGNSHTATLTVKSTEAEDKIISLKGSATVAKIYTKTDLANITKYDEVLIVGTNASGSFAMANDEATNSGPKAISVTVDNNKIATDITNIQWSVGNTDGKLIFAPKDAETWLYCINNNDGLRIGSDAEAMTFEIKDDYIYNTIRNRYIGIYNSQEWRSYTLTSGGSFPTNIKEQTFAFYIIKGVVPDDVYSITYNTNGGNTISPTTDETTIPNVLPTPSKEGYNFAGWYTDEALTIPVVTGTALTSDITLYAKWADPYSVAYARTLIDADVESAGIYAYVAGVVTAVEEINTVYGNATYSIGDTEDATETLKVFRGNYLNNVQFTEENQLKVGDQVVVYGKMINHTTGGYQFSQGNYIYKLTSAAGKETTSLSWSATTCKVQIGETNTFPTLTKSHDITIKYTSSHPSVATIANDGTITLVAAGTTTITAAIEEDETYAPSSASYVLTVVEVVPTGIFRLYSGELTEGEYVLVDGAKDKALKAAVANTTRLAGEDVAIADNAILNPDASIVWNLAKSGEEWTIFNEYEGKYVAGTGAASAAQLLTVGTDANALWTVTGTETYDFVNKANEASSVNSHLRWGGSYWACYGSTTGKALRLYKKIDVPTPIISHPSGTYLGSQNVTISCALATATIYYTINGDAPTTSSASITPGGTVSITESCTLKAIAVANEKESALVEATYEIVATGGVWVLVDNATALEAGDLLVLASNAHNVVAGTIADGKDFMTSVGGAVFNANKTIMTTLPANAMMLTLGGSEDAWTFEYQEMYLNASGSKNSLGTPATTWTITIDENGAAITTDGNTIKYNATSPRFKVYSTSTGNLPQIYKYTADFYTRDLTNNQYGTICLKNGGVVVAGAKIFEIAYKNTQTNRVLVDEVVRLKAGVPYVFLPNAAQIKIALDGTTAGTASKVNGLQGTFVEIQDGDAGATGNILEGNHMLYNNSILKCGGNCTLPAYRAYFIVGEISTTEKANAPGRQRIALGYQGENAATGLDNITEIGVIAPAMQGTYDVLGRQLSEPTATGFYIVNGKKVFVVK